MMRAVVLILACVSSAIAYQYEGYAQLGVTPNTRAQASQLKALLDEGKYDIWTESRVLGQSIHFLAPPEKIQAVHQAVQQMGLTVETLDADVGKTVETERQRLAQRKARLTPGQFDFDIDDFNTYDDMMTQLTAYANSCPTGFTCEVTNAGNSHEGNAINYLKVSIDGQTRQAIWIDGLIHAREWIVGPTVMWFIQEMWDNYGSDTEITAMLDTYDWYFMPVVNPDGYMYTWSDERLWRKNRQPNDGSACVGTDLNRNFDHDHCAAGSSDQPCQDTYCGESPASAPETQVLQDMATSLGSSTLVWVSMHAYAHMWLHPYGSINNGACSDSPDHTDQNAAASAAETASENADATDNTDWTSGPVCTTIYPASGSTCDYVYETGGVTYSYTPELRGTSFIIDAGQIPAAYQEAWKGVVAIINYAAANQK